MIRKKSSEADEQVIYDENADSVERVAAISRLAVDGYEEMEPFLANLLQQGNYQLRRIAINVLLAGWGQSKYLNKVIEILHTDFDENLRVSAARSLGTFAMRFENGQKHKQRILQELIKQLQIDEDFIVQTVCYEEAYKIIKDKRFGVDFSRYGAHPSDFFNRDRDVDWELLKPYMENA